MADSPDGEEMPVIELGGGWCAALLSADQWRAAVQEGPLQRFVAFDPPTPYVYVITKITSSSQPFDIASRSETGTFVAPLGVPEDTPEALYVALINAQAHEALEWVQIMGDHGTSRSAITESRVGSSRRVPRFRRLAAPPFWTRRLLV